MARTRDSNPKHTLSRETGTIIKDWGGRLPVALVYPNSYYLGMSNLGIHAIYKLLNGYSDVVCERVFREKGQQEPSGLKSGRPLTDYAVIAFSVTYELDYFNVVSILRASGIPLYASEGTRRTRWSSPVGPALPPTRCPFPRFLTACASGRRRQSCPRCCPYCPKVSGEAGQTC